jgi:glycosyltransferase involved in cell wall biosynthesis
MFKLSVCVLTYNSVRLLSEVLKILIKIADEIIILNSGNIANTINISRGYGIE